MALGPRTLLTTCTNQQHSEVTQEDVPFLAKNIFRQIAKITFVRKQKYFPSSNSPLQDQTLEAVLQGGISVPVTLLTQHPDSGLCLVTADMEVLDGEKETAPLLVPACLAPSLEPGSLLQQEVTLYHLLSNSSAPPHQEYKATRSI